MASVVQMEKFDPAVHISAGATVEAGTCPASAPPSVPEPSVVPDTTAAAAGTGRDDEPEGQQQQQQQEEESGAPSHPARLAVCLYMLPGGEGELLLRESIRSWCNSPQVTGLYVVDTGAVSREGDVRAIATPDLVEVVHVVHGANLPYDAGFQLLIEAAEGDGFTHGLLARSHEILRCEPDGGMLEDMFEGWEDTDVAQVTTNTLFRPQADIFIRLSHFQMIGPMIPAPFPLVPHVSLRVHAWDNLSVACHEFKLPRHQFLQYAVHIHAGLRVAGLPVAARGFLSKQLSEAYYLAGVESEACKLVEQRIQEGPRGWAGEQGLYVALLRYATWPAEKDLEHNERAWRYLKAADMGLRMRRFEAVYLFSCYLRQLEFKDVPGLVSLAVMGRRHLCDGSPFCGDAAIVRQILDEAGVAAFYMDNMQLRSTSYACLIGAAQHPSAKHNKRIQSNTQFVRSPGDDRPEIKHFPRPTDHILPEIITLRNFIDDPEAVATGFGDTTPLNFRFLLVALSQALHAPCPTHFVSDPACVRVDTSAALREATVMTPSEGYVVLVGLRGTARVEIVYHYETGFRGPPTLEELAGRAESQADIEAMIQHDAGLPDAWGVDSTIRCAPGTFLAIRAGQYFRVRADGDDTALLCSTVGFSPTFWAGDAEWAPESVDTRE